MSIILPVYNGENYLRFAVESVLGQTCQDFELIAVDDGSTDATPEILQCYGDQLKYIRQANTGAAGAFNHGLRSSVGRYVSWLSHDDVFVETKLEKQVRALQAVGTPAVCYTDFETIDALGKVTGQFTLPQHDRRELLRHIVTGGPVCTASYSIMYDRACVMAVGSYAESWKCTEDVDMLARLARRFPFVRVPERLTKIREHEQRAIHSKRWEREVVVFFHAKLNVLSISELFPELGETVNRSVRAQARSCLGDMLAERPFPIYTVARSQYMRAILDNPRGVFGVTRKMYDLFVRETRHRNSRWYQKTTIGQILAHTGRRIRRELERHVLWRFR